MQCCLESQVSFISAGSWFLFLRQKGFHIILFQDNDGNVPATTCKSPPSSVKSWLKMGDTGTVAYCGQQLIGVSIAIAVAQITIVGARFYTRYMQKVACGSDDYFVIPALVRMTRPPRFKIMLISKQIASLGQSVLYVFRLWPFIGSRFAIQY